MKACLANAMINAVENLRDEEGISDGEFRGALQSNVALADADEYLESGLADCLCPEVPVTNFDGTTIVTEDGGVAVVKELDPEEDDETECESCERTARYIVLDRSGTFGSDVHQCHACLVSSWYYTIQCGGTNDTWTF